MLEAFVQFLQSPEFLSFAATYGAMKLLDASISKVKQFKRSFKKSSHEWQLIDSLEQALFETEKSSKWKHDTNAINESFFDSLFTFSGTFSSDSIAQIFKKAVGHDVTNDDIELWIDNFLKQLSFDEHQELREYIKLHHLLTVEPSWKPWESSYDITSRAPRWENKEIICRDEFTEMLCQELSIEYPHIQLVGMGGIGKTEILNKLYIRLLKNCGASGFDHVGFVNYEGAIELDIEQRLDYPKEYKGLQGPEAAVSYLHDLCANKRVLLIIDDIRDCRSSLKFNSLLEVLRSLQVAIVLASRAAAPQFDIRKVGFLPTKACIEIFTKQRGEI